jgi:hypothetical protein
MISVLFEYIFLVVNIIWIVKELIRKFKEKQKEKKENGGKEKPKEGPGYVYKWVKAKNLMEEGVKNKEIDFFSKDYKLKSISDPKDKSMLEKHGKLDIGKITELAGFTTT